MDPLKASLALQRLILRHYPALLQYRAEGAVLIRMDESGNVVDFPTTSPDAGGNNPKDPKPGDGYYAHIQLTGIVVGAAVGGERMARPVRKRLVRGDLTGLRQRIRVWMAPCLARRIWR